MPSGRPASFRLIPLVLLVIGGAALAGITLMPQSATRMYTSPWRVLYWIALLAPPAALMGRAALSGSLRLPSARWTMLAWCAAATVLLSAFLSPHRGAALEWAAVPLSAIALFFVVHDWLHAAPGNEKRWETLMACASGVVLIACIGWWLTDVVAIIRDGRFRAIFFEMRNPHPFGHSNYTAGLALLALPWLVHHAKKSLGRARGLAIVAALFALVALFTSGSRGGLLGLVVAFAIAMVFSNIRGRRLVIAGVIALVAIGIFAASIPRVRSVLRAPDPAAAPNASTVQRVAMLEAGVQMGTNRPALGWGLHTTPLVYPRFRAKVDGGAENVLQLHSLPVEIWAGLGAAGLLVLAGFVAFAARDARRHAPAAVALGSYGVFALTDYQLDVPFFAFAIAVLAARIAPPRPAASSPMASRLVAAVTGLCLVAVVSFGAPDPTPGLNAEALASARADATPDRAIALFGESLRLNPAQEIAHFNLGWLLVVSDPAKAETHFRRAALLVPDKGGVYFGIGLARLNQGDAPEAARLFALECINDPRFLSSPWWKEAGIAELRDASREEFMRMIERIAANFGNGTWRAAQAQALAAAASQLGEVGSAPERNYRRQRTGYTVLMRNHDIAAPVDLYDVRESDPAEGSPSLPPKGWLPAPLLLNLLDERPATRQ